MISSLTSLAVAVVAIAAPSPTADARYDALVRDYAAACAGWEERYAGDERHPIPPERMDTIGRYRDYPAWAFAPRFLKLAEDHPDDPAAVDSLLWIVDLAMSVGTSDRDLRPVHDRALELLGSRYLDHPATVRAWRALRNHGLTATQERVLRHAAERSQSREARGVATLALAHLLASRAEVARDPWFARPNPTPFQVYLIGRQDPTAIESIRRCDPKPTAEEAERRFEAAARDYGDVVAIDRGGRKTTVRECAEDELRERRTLAVGQVGPEIAGVDADGHPFKLSDYRGKVVLLTFSGNWCGPCKAMYPFERTLVERYKDRPFALLSVNTDEDRATLQAAIRSGEITWRCWWDGSTTGTICNAWNAGPFPTIYLLDDRGVIRHKQPREEAEIDRAIATLLDEVAHR